ncbi:hypothetical protein GCM10011369_35270 [Neiella marina]|uniref:Uncharacterized protein n=1 Tax=Neiella marina TaxID=508461 RepID=A0A8J2UA83_9GAMM|nr:hypothetical protein [Neiella marina]GGA90048.1 hypothetical protein GCM10011369_35270 [Neiella marina]
MKELKESELSEVKGGFVALYWVGVGAVHAYRTYRAVRFGAQAVGGGALYDGLKTLITS